MMDLSLVPYRHLIESKKSVAIYEEIKGKSKSTIKKWMVSVFNNNFSIKYFSFIIMFLCCLGGIGTWILFEFGDPHFNFIKKNYIHMDASGWSQSVIADGEGGGSELPFLVFGAAILDFMAVRY